MANLTRQTSKLGPPDIMISSDEEEEGVSICLAYTIIVSLSVPKLFSPPTNNHSP